MILKSGGALALGLALMPTAAFSVGTSSDDGAGWQTRKQAYSNGASTNGVIRSTRGDMVYHSGQVARNNCEDVGTGRYTSNVTSLTNVGNNERIITTWMNWPCHEFQGVRAKICRVRNNVPDACGAWSSRF